MAKLLTVMGWNIENFGTSKYNSHGQRLINFIAQVIHQNQVDIAAFSEMRSNLAGPIGTAIAARLDNIQALAAGTWHSQASIQMVPKRLEQYLFVWNSNVATTYNGAPDPVTGVANSVPFQWLYNNPAPPPARIGFPRQITGDRPPFSGYFQATDSHAAVRQVLVAVMHSAEPGFRKDTRDAARNIALITEFNNNGETCVLVGDFNVKYQSDAAVVNSLGAGAFGNLVAANFVQAMNPIDMETSLIKAVHFIPPPAMVAADYQNQPYDQVFFRTTAAVGGVALNHQPAYCDDVIPDCLAGQYLTGLLGAIHDTVNGNPIGTRAYGANLNDAFVDYRHYVSDHLPVFIQVDD